MNSASIDGLKDRGECISGVLRLIRLDAEVGHLHTDIFLHIG
jgi:hypothetical protein